MLPPVIATKPTPDTTHSAQWLPFVDGIRGYMALWVFVGHAAWMSGNHVPLISSPALAVDVFMVISGLLMAHHFLLRQHAEPWHAPASWWAFYVRRFFRIAPLYYLLLVPAFLFAGYYSGLMIQLAQYHIPGQLQSFQQLQPDTQPTPANVLMHYSFLFGLCPRFTMTTSMPDWSIGLEMQFYLVFPFLMLAFRRWSSLLVVVPLLLLQWASVRWLGGPSLGGPMESHRYIMPSFLPLKVSYFLTGILLALAFHERKQSGRSARLVVLALFCTFLFSEDLVLPVLVAGITALLFFEPTPSRSESALLHGLHRFLTNRLARFLGDISYGLYLLHLLIMVPVAVWLFHLEPRLPLGSSTVRAVVLLALVAVPVFGLSWLAHCYVERPGIAFGKRFLRRSPQSIRKQEVFVASET